MAAADRASWRDIPDRYGPWQTIYERFARWEANGTWATMKAPRFPPPALGGEGRGVAE